MVNSLPAPERAVRDRLGIHPASPTQMSGGIIFVGPLPLEHGFGPTIVQLLLPVGPNRAPPMMPDHGSGTESQHPPLLLQPPAKIHIITGNPKRIIKSIYAFNAFPPECHVTARK